MERKRFVDARDLTRDSFRLARLVLDSGWLPQLLVALWRGGTPIGIAVHEFLLYCGVATDHAVLKCGSYSGIGVRGDLHVARVDDLLAVAGAGRRVLLVDDIFDSGRTADRIAGLFAAAGAHVRTATLFWKPTHNQTARHPDYHVHVTDEWVVFPHELAGLTPEEIRAKDPVVHDLLFAPGP